MLSGALCQIIFRYKPSEELRGLQLTPRMTGVINKGGYDEGGMWHGWKEKGMYGGFLAGKPAGNGPLGRSRGCGLGILN